MAKKEANNLSKEDYQVLQINDEVSLVYSKTRGDNLPISVTQLAERTLVPADSPFKKVGY